MANRSKYFDLRGNAPTTLDELLVYLRGPYLDYQLRIHGEYAAEAVEGCANVLEKVLGGLDQPAPAPADYTSRFGLARLPQRPRPHR